MGLETLSPSPPRTMDTIGGAGFLPLAVLGHLQGPSGGHWGAATPSIRDAQDFHGLSLWPPFPMTTQHGGVHTFPRGVCGPRVSIQSKDLFIQLYMVLRWEN